MSTRNPDDQFRQDVLLRLDVIVALLLDAPGAGGQPSTSAKIQRLLGLGFSQAQTASMVRKPANYVSAVIAESKKRKGRTRGTQSDE
jgi:hypothetical protein